MHVETSRSHQTLKDGTERVYQRHLLRRSYREGGKVRQARRWPTCRALPAAAIDGDPRRCWRARPLVRRRRRRWQVDRGRCRTGTWPRCTRRPAGWACRSCWARPAGSGTWRLALIVSRVVRPALEAVDPRPGGPTSPWAPTWGWPARRRMRCTRRWTGCARRQDAIEAELARRHLSRGRAWRMFDLSSLVGGGHALPAGRARLLPRRQAAASRRSSTGCSPTRPGRPVAIRVFPGNTADPTAFIAGRRAWCAASFGLRRADPGRGPRDDHLGADRRRSQRRARTTAVAGSPACAPRRSTPLAAEDGPLQM